MYPQNFGCHVAVPACALPNISHTGQPLVCYTAVFSVVTQRSSQWEGALRDDSKNGCVAD